MKLLISFLVVIFISSVGVNAFTTPVATVANTFTRLQAQQQQNDNDADADVVYSRRDALRKSATTFASVASVGVLATTIIPTMAHADIYDDQEKERKLKRAQDSEEQKKLIPKKV